MTTNLSAAEWRVLFSLGAGGSAERCPNRQIIDQLIGQGYVERRSQSVLLSDAGWSLIMKYVMPSDARLIGLTSRDHQRHRAEKRPPAL